MKIQQHRDRIEELKHTSSNLKWKAATLLTGYLGVVSIMYLIWYNQVDLISRILLGISFTYVTLKIGKETKKIISKAVEVNKQITRNFDRLLGRKENSHLQD